MWPLPHHRQSALVSAHRHKGASTLDTRVGTQARRHDAHACVHAHAGTGKQARRCANDASEQIAGASVS